MNKNGCCVLNSALNCAKGELKERNVHIKKYFWVCPFFFGSLLATVSRCLLAS